MWKHTSSIRGRSAHCAAYYLLLVQGCFATGSPSVGGPQAPEAPNPRPGVTLALDSDEVYVGELPVLQVHVRAPASADVLVVKPQRASFGFLFTDLIAANGTRVPGGLPVGTRNVDPRDFELLRSGRESRFKAEVLSRPPDAGRYTVRVRFHPTGDRRYAVEEQFALTSKVLEERDVLERTELEIPASANKGRDRSKIDFIKVRTGGGLILFYRRSLPDGSVLLQRVMPIKHDAKVKAEAVGLDVPRTAGRIRLTVIGAKRETVTWLSYYSGSHLEVPVA